MTTSMHIGSGASHARPAATGAAHLAAHDACATPHDARALYALLAQGGDSAELRQAARQFLLQQLELAAGLPCDFPENEADADGWIAANTAKVGQQYHDYLAARKEGGPRRYFSGKAHALHFLRGAAPTKLVDGAWLYAMLQRWRDDAMQPLIAIYLEELGDGVPDKNHVLLYKKLLATHGITDWQQLDDSHFVQGAIQLAFAHCGTDFLPELIGFNLGYEQLPLHLLISAYELNELGIDPYYFTLHVTVDNAATGHACTALQGMRRLLEHSSDKAGFLRRLRAGMRLNELGASTMSIIDGFSLDDEVAAMLSAKATFGANMHSDYCRVGGRTVNEWLADPAQVPAFLRQLEKQGWIRRGEAPEHSRFWRLVHGERAEMFGVFTAYEQQLLQDWIGTGPDGASALPRTASYRALRRSREDDGAAVRQEARRPRGLIRHRYDSHEPDTQECELRRLEAQLAASSRSDALHILIPLMSPARHHTATGLMATRMFRRLYAEA